MKASLIPEHWNLILTPDEGVRLRSIAEDLRQAERDEPGCFGLGDADDELLEELVDLLSGEDKVLT